MCGVTGKQKKPLVTHSPGGGSKFTLVTVYCIPELSCLCLGDGYFRLLSTPPQMVSFMKG